MSQATVPYFWWSIPLMPKGHRPYSQPDPICSIQIAIVVGMLMVHPFITIVTNIVQWCYLIMVTMLSGSVRPISGGCASCSRCPWITPQFMGRRQRDEPKGVEMLPELYLNRGCFLALRLFVTWYLNKNFSAGLWPCWLRH